MTDFFEMRRSIGNVATAEQQKASNPKDCVWVEASAGTGKTKILSDRVLRLLLLGVNPSKILALTYTKAAAVEMSERIYHRLSNWVSANDDKIKKELYSLLGYDVDEAMVVNARRLFATILDAPINIRVMTIHAFCQEILKRFSFEAKVSPYFEVIDEIRAKEITQNIKSEILVDEELYSSIAYLSENTTENGFSDILKSIIDNRTKLSKNNNIKELDVDFAPKLNIDMQGLEFDDFKLKYLTKDGGIRKKMSEEDAQIAQEVLDYDNKLKTLNLYLASKAVFEIGSKFVEKYEAYKKENSLMDYEDLIFWTNKLLQDDGVSEWVLYKLDGGIDHILIDEAQDTSYNQWNIILSIAEEFFASKNSKTLFVVGDRKQSIYSFQGADVKNFDEIKKYLFAKNNEFKEINLKVSFRSTAPILNNVNNVFKKQNLSHTPYRVGDQGEIYVWDLITSDKKEKKEWSFSKERNSKESASQKLAKKIALKIKTMVDDGYVLQSKKRAVKYQDFLILVQRRNSFVDELVREMKSCGVSVLGVDRLSLLEQICVLDFIALAKFLLLPSDDLSLACVLKSPIFGLDDNDLMELCINRDKASLYNRLRDNQKYEGVYETLKTLLNMADYVRVFELFSYVLNNLEGRKKIISRLGYEAIDAVDEFMNLTIAFEKDNIVSLQNFVDWIEKDEIQIKRQLETGVDAVRIMTAHGSKGLQAPIVIMPDTVRVPKSSKKAKMLFDEGMLYPLSSSYYQDDAEAMLEKIKDEEFYEYQRLLYVALTRPEDILLVCGYSNTDKIDENCWYNSIKNSIAEIGFRDEDGLCYKNVQEIKVEAKREKKSKDFEIFDTGFLFSKAKKVEFDAKPYAPSKMGEDEEEFELNPDNQKFIKGLAIHKILQYMKEFDKAKIGDFLRSHNLNPALEVDVLKLFENKDLEALFAEGSRAEVNVCGKVGDKIINGVIDRLVVKDNEVLVVDYKTDKNVGEVPQKYKNQLNAYRSLLQEIYPEKEIRCFVLWTQNCQLAEI